MARPKRRRTNSASVVEATGAVGIDKSDGDAADTASVLKGEVQHMQGEILKLRTIVEQNQVHIKQLTSQLTFVLSMLGLQDVPAIPDTNCRVVPGLSATDDNVEGRSYADAARSSQSLSQSGSSFSDVAIAAQISAQPAMDNTSGSGGAGDGADAVRKLKSRFHQNLVSAVYREQKDKRRRTCNVVVSGLSAAGSSDATDQVRLRHIFQTEFGRDVSIKNCKRLGLHIQGRIQSVLVSLNEAQDAEFLVSHARQLRNSNDSYIKQNLFINPDLTRAERQSAFEDRSRRRGSRKPTAAASKLDATAADFNPVPVPVPALSSYLSSGSATINGNGSSSGSQPPGSMEDTDGVDPMY